MPTEDENAEMFAAVYDELRRIARKYFTGRGANFTLQPTALVNEAFAKMVRQRNLEPGNEAQFKAVAAMVLKRKFFDYLDKKGAAKRGGGVAHTELDDKIADAMGSAEKALELKQALERLEKLHARQARVVEMRYFTGLKNDEIADALGISVATVKTDWNVARAFLYSELNSGDELK